MAFAQKRFVFTGGPCSGKTTLLKCLAERGFRTVPEAAATVIERELAKGTDVLPWANLAAFQTEVLKLQLALEDSADGNVVICDRGLPDGVAYYRLGGLQPAPELLNLCTERRYDGVFFLGQLPSFDPDNIRRETPETAEKLSGFIKDAYSGFGYAPIEVPPIPVNDRASLVIRALLAMG
jgi:predicted ATPase